MSFYPPVYRAAGKAHRARKIKAVDIMTRLQRAEGKLQKMQNGACKLSFPLATFREMQHVQKRLEYDGFAATINSDVLKWYQKQGFHAMDYGIGFRIFANKEGFTRCMK